jgi:RNA polymerase sigma-70 factor (ECF subfamily)
MKCVNVDETTMTGGRSTRDVTVGELENSTVFRSGGPTGVPSFALPIVTFDDLLDRHQAEIYRFTMQLTRNRADADDLYQETLIKAYRAFDRLDGDANHRAWLYRIATNTFLSGKRKAKREDPLDETLEAVLPADPVDHVADFEAQDLLAEVQRFVETLPDKQRIALILRKYHEMEYGEIAANLKSSEAAARANVHEALRKLRACFGDRI